MTEVFMGLLGGILLFGGLVGLVLGLIGIITNLIIWDMEGVIMSAFLFSGSLVAGTVGTAILE